ncbi:25717_t:CDS:1, partial [Gigaspora rosea]
QRICKDEKTDKKLELEEFVGGLENVGCGVTLWVWEVEIVEFD